MGRESWDKFWMRQAFEWANRSTCASNRSVGCIAVRDNRMVSTGYNAVPSKWPHPEVCPRKQQGLKSGEGLDLCPCIHAEENLIINAARIGVSLMGTEVYSTDQICTRCLPKLINVGVTRIVYARAYPSPMFDSMVELSGIEAVRMDPTD